MSKKTNNVDVEALVAKTTGLPTSAAVSAALVSLQKKQEEEQQAEIIQNISRIQQHVKSKVEHLQYVRRKEKEAKKSLQIVADAEQAFLKSGDMEAFRKTLEENGMYC